MNNLTTGKQILIGSSMGSWLMLLATLEQPDRVASLIGIASAPDFTEYLIWEKMLDYEKKELMENGIFYLKSDFSDNPYPVTKNLIEDGRKHLLLHKNININCPVRLIHGLKDDDVPSSVSTQLATQLTSKDVKLKLVEKGDHKMSEPEHMQLICNTLESLLNL